MHALLVRRADDLADSSEGSAEAAEPVAIVDAIEAYGGKRWPLEEAAGWQKLASQVRNFFSLSGTCWPVSFGFRTTGRSYLSHCRRSFQATSRPLFDKTPPSSARSS